MGIPQTIILNIKTNDDTILSGRLQFILPENISIDGDSELKTHQISSEKDGNFNLNLLISLFLFFNIR